MSGTQGQMGGIQQNPQMGQGMGQPMGQPMVAGQGLGRPMSAGQPMANMQQMIRPNTQAFQGSQSLMGQNFPQGGAQNPYQSGVPSTLQYVQQLQAQQAAQQAQQQSDQAAAYPYGERVGGGN